ncbi:hypothetical protein QTP88_024291 [Uroleucon formosanum]
MFHLMIIILVVSICEIQALPCGYPDSLAVNRYYSGPIEENHPKNYVTVNVIKIIEKADTRIRRDVNGVLATAIPEPSSATSDGARILVADAPVADQCNARSKRSRIPDGRRKRDGFDGTTTRWYDKPFTRPITAHRSPSTCESLQGSVSGRPVTSFGPKSVDGYCCQRFGGQTAATGPRHECYGVRSAATDLRRNTDTATALRTPENRHWLKKLHHASAFPVTGGVKKRLSVSLRTVVPKRLHMATRATNGLRRLSTKCGTHMKRSRRFIKLNASPVAKSPDGQRLSIVTMATLASS